jgi:hypothetical protein
LCLTMKMGENIETCSVFSHLRYDLCVLVFLSMLSPLHPLPKKKSFAFYRLISLCHELHMMHSFNTIVETRKQSVYFYEPDKNFHFRQNSNRKLGTS